MGTLNYSRVMGIAFERPAYKGEFSFATLLNSSLPLAKQLLHIDKKFIFAENAKSYISISNFRFSNSFLQIYENNAYSNQYFVVSTLDLLLRELGQNTEIVKHTTAFYKFLYNVEGTFQYLSDNPWIYKYVGLKKFKFYDSYKLLISYIESIDKFIDKFSLEGEWGGDIMVKTKRTTPYRSNLFELIPLLEYRRRFLYD